jgi:hypothetical protein
MSRHTAELSSNEQEVRFALGTLLGMTVFAAGFALAVLALSVNVRDPVDWFPRIAKDVGMYGGLALIPLSYFARLRSRRLGNRVALAGFVLFILVGSTAVVYKSGSPQVSQIDRWALGLLSLAGMVGGAGLVRRAAREVGW